MPTLGLISLGSWGCLHSLPSFAGFLLVKGRLNILTCPPVFGSTSPHGSEKPTTQAVGESSIKDTNQGLVGTCRLRRDSGSLEEGQSRVRRMKGLESKPGTGTNASQSRSAAWWPYHKQDFIFGRFGF